MRRTLILCVLLGGCVLPGAHYAAPERVATSDGSVYSADDCIGPAINGRCHGTILHPGPARSKCYGTWSMGRCIGPEF